MKRKRTRKPWRHAKPKGPDVFSTWPAAGEPEPAEVKEAAEHLGLAPIGGTLRSVPVPGDGGKKSEAAC